MFRQYGGLFADAEKEFAAKRGLWIKPVVVVPIASQEESSFKFASIEEPNQFASQEELLIASKEESSKQFASIEESHKGFMPLRQIPVVVVPMENQTSVVGNSKPPVVVVPMDKSDGMGRYSSVVNSPQPRSTYQFADALSNGVVNSLRKESNQFDAVSNNGVVANSSDPSPKLTTNSFLQHHQDPPRRAASAVQTSQRYCPKHN